MVPPEDAYTVFVLGASGDLAKKKVYPSLYELYLSELLPTRILIVGYARSSIADDAFRASIRAFLTAGTDAQRDGFLALCIYRAGGYDDAAAFRKVRKGGMGRAGEGCDGIFFARKCYWVDVCVWCCITHRNWTQRSRT